VTTVIWVVTSTISQSMKLLKSYSRYYFYKREGDEENKVEEYSDSKQLLYRGDSMKKFISLLLAMILILSLCVTSFAQMSDVEYHWAKEAINYLVEKGVLGGYPDGTFKMDNPMSKAEFYKVINELLGFEKKAEVTYSDVFPEDWFYDHVAKALAAGYISPTTLLSPNDYITRQEVARIIGDLYNIDNTSESTRKFSDSSLISKEISGYIGTMVDIGILSGYSNGSFRPNSNITRAEVATIINNVLKNLDIIVKEIVDKSELDVFIKEAIDLDKDNYTKTTWNKLTEVLESAMGIYNGGNATQDEVDEILGKLQVAIDSLKKVSKRPQSKMTANPATVTKYNFFYETFTLSIANDTLLNIDYGDLVLGGVFENLYIESVSTLNDKTVTMKVFGDLNGIGTGTITLKASSLSSGKPLTAEVTVVDLPVYTIKTTETNFITEPVIITPTEADGDVEIYYEPWGVLELPEGLKINGDLIINAPYATVNNYSEVSGEIIVKNAAIGTWNEYQDGNKIIIEDQDGIVLNILGDVSAITISQAAGGSITLDIGDEVDVDNIESITINKPIDLIIPRPIRAKVSPDIRINVRSSDNYLESYMLTGIGKELEIEIPANLIEVSSIVVTSYEYESVIRVGDTLQMSAVVLPENASYKEVKWSVIDENVTGSATIDSNGLLTGTGIGEVRVSADAIDGSWKYNEKVIIVKEPGVRVTGITLSKTSMVLNPVFNYLLKATIYPEGASIKDIIWTSSDESVASVEKDDSIGMVGSIKPRGLGTATITAKTKDGGYIASCDVEVKNFYSFWISGPEGSSESNLPQEATPEDSQVIITLKLKEGQSIGSFLVNNFEKKDELIDNKYSFLIKELTEVYYKIKLAQVPQPTWSDSVINWEAVDDAQSYSVYVYKDGGEEHIVEANLTSTSNSYDCENIILENGVGSYKVSIKAKGNEFGFYIDGDKSELSEVINGIEIKGYNAIQDVDAGRAGSAKYDSTADVLKALPTSVAIIGTTGTVPVSVIWSETSTPEYDATKSGIYVFTGTIGAIPEGYVDDIDTISTVTVNVVVAPKQYTLTLAGARISSKPEAGLIDENTEVTVTVSPAAGQSISSFWYKGYVKYEDDLEKDGNTYTYTFNMTEDVIVNSIIKLAQVSQPTWLGTVINWEAVDDASYVGFVYKDGKEVGAFYPDSNTLSRDISDIINSEGLGSYTVRVRANPAYSDGYLGGEDSSESEPMIITTKDDKSGFNVTLLVEGTKTQGVEFDLNITEAKELLGNDLGHGSIKVTVVSDKDGIPFEKSVGFNNGVPREPIRITLSSPGTHILTVGVDRVTNPMTVTVTVE